jgi:glycosyltransferase involved in cell wall biosynthesis
LRAHHVGLLFDRPLTRNAELSSPNKLFEYLMAGLAVVAPRLAGVAFVEREQLGLLAEPNSPTALASALERLAQDVSLLDELRVNARQTAVERYNAGAQRELLAAAWSEPRLSSA